MKRIFALCLALMLSLCLTVTAWADYDYIDRYDVTVTPNTEDGSLAITVSLTWTALEELPYGQELKIGIPNGAIRAETALSDNIESLSYDNSYMYVYLDRAYDDGETFTFSYSWVQEYMYTLEYTSQLQEGTTEGARVSYDYTPGWFDEARIGEMTLTWNDPAGVRGEFGQSEPNGGTVTLTETGLTMHAEDMDYGQTMSVLVTYDNWPAELYYENSTGGLPVDYMSGYDGGWYDGDDWYYDDWYYDDYYYSDYDDGDSGLAGLVIVLLIVIVVVHILVRCAGDGYSGGFGTRYVLYRGLWYPMGHDGRPRPGSVGTKHKPKPPSRGGGGGFGGGSRGGGFGGGGFGGGGHCACASSCACACACACAGGGRAGCSAKNLYGAVKLDKALTDSLTGKEE